MPTAPPSTEPCPLSPSTASHQAARSGKGQFLLTTFKEAYDAIRPGGWVGPPGRRVCTACCVGSSRQGVDWQGVQYPANLVSVARPF